MRDRTPSASSGAAVTRGVAWAFLGVGVSKVAWMGGLIFLARLLTPEQFGLFAFSLVFIAYVETVGDLGTSAALVHWPSRRDEAARVTFWANVVLALVWFAVAQILAGPVAAFFGSPEGEPLLRVLAVSFLIRGLGNTHDALCRKDLRFRARMLPEASMALTKTGIALVLAFAGFGAWSLVVGQLAGLGLRTVALWRIVPWRPRPGVPGDLVGPMVRYGGGIVAVNVLGAVVHHVDLVVVGRFLGVGALGIYQIASKIPEASLTVAIWTVSQVLFPAFSRDHALGRDLSRSYLVALRYVSLLTLPAALGLVLVAEPLVLAAFGESWAPAVPVLRALALYVALRSLGTHAGDVLKATGRTRLLAGLAAVKATILVPALVLAASGGATSVALALAGVTGANAALGLAVAARLLELSTRDLLRALSPALRVSALLLVPAGCWHLWAPDIGAPGELALLGTLGLAAYLGALAVVEPEALARLRSVLREATSGLGSRLRAGGRRGSPAVREETVAEGGAGAI